MMIELLQSAVYISFIDPIKQHFYYERHNYSSVRFITSNSSK